MVNKKVTMRDYYRTFITKANKEAGVTYNASKLNSKEECEEYLLNLIRNLRHKKQDNKAYVKEIDNLKEEIEILNTNNKTKLDLEQDMNLLKIKGENFSSEIYDIKGEIKNPNIQPIKKNKISSLQKNKTGNGDIVVFILGIIALISLPFAFMIDDGKTGGNSDSSSDDSYYDSGSYGGGDCGGGYSGGGSW